jgi:hypothetical protein
MNLLNYSISVAEFDMDCFVTAGAGLERFGVAALTSRLDFPCAQDMTAFPPASHDAFSFDDLLSPKERETRYRVRAFMV